MTGRRALAEFWLADAGRTEALGRALAPRLRQGDVLGLAGPLGAGKTSLARALIRALPGPAGCESEAVPSPTFTLLQVYERQPAPVWHFDLYRLERPAEVWELGWEQALAEGIVLVEWPERLATLLPGAALLLTLAHGRSAEEGRQAVLTGPPPWDRRLAGLQLDAP
jgi:tRNA threonylcarbamoyladenosine biosynthesis protein TsaE